MRQSRDARKRPRKRQMLPCQSRCGTLRYRAECRGIMGRREHDGKQAQAGLSQSRVRV